MNQRLNIAFVHPNLGLGGAERLVVDASVYLREAGHRVTIFTAHHDRSRCFEETRDGTLDVRVRGDFLPRQIGRWLRAPCAVTRMAYLAGTMVLERRRFDVIFCDLVSHALPLLRRVHRCPVVFYCHFPDRLLIPSRSFLYGLYRAPIDWLEAVTTASADRILVNSRFTADVVRRAFPRLRNTRLEVLYPGVDCDRFDRLDAGSRRGPVDGSGPLTVVSLNRYGRRKNLGLAIEALALLRERVPASRFERIQLVIAGGYDDRMVEHRRVFEELQALARARGVSEQVSFRRSIDDAERLRLLAECVCVVYTPAEEHFGIVPVEAMAAGRPVVAVAGGGVMETVRHGETGLLCAPTPAAFSAAIERLINEPQLAEQMGRAGRRRARESFSRAVFGARLESLLREVATEPRRRASPRP